MSKKATDSDSVIDYRGYEPSPGIVHSIDTVPATIDVEEFFSRFIAQRKPVMIKGLLTDKEWKGHRWTNKYLKNEAGKADVIVEQRGPKEDATFGLMAPKVSMTYGEFIDSIMNDNDRLYLTTQDLERFEDDLDDFEMPKSVFAQPLKSLADDFPLQPRLLGSLIPYQLSLWQGLAKDGSSSGLHHDYHDNLYMLLRGRKRFRLFAPSAVPHMKTAGIPARVHSNGLIVYRNKPDDSTVVVRADGVPMSFLIRQRKDEAEVELIEAEEALDDLLSSDIPEQQKTAERQRLESKLEECEARIDAAMDDMLVYGCPGTSHSDYDSDEDGEPEAKKSKSETSESSSQPIAPSVKMPDHFCDLTIPTHSDNADIMFTAHPHLRQVGCIVCELHAGDMLYLPASWFHEVTSYSDDNPPKPSESGDENLKCSEDKGHLALNYWMYPPDGDSFSAPYRDNFWSRRWDTIKDGPPPPIQKVWSSDDEEDEEAYGDGEDDDTGSC